MGTWDSQLQPLGSVAEGQGATDRKGLAEHGIAAFAVLTALAVYTRFALFMALAAFTPLAVLQALLSLRALLCLRPGLCVRPRLCVWPLPCVYGLLSLFVRARVGRGHRPPSSGGKPSGFASAFVTCHIL